MPHPDERQLGPSPAGIGSIPPAVVSQGLTAPPIRTPHPQFRRLDSGAGIRPPWPTNRGSSRRRRAPAGSSSRRTARRRRRGRRPPVPGTGIRRVAVVLWLITPMATSSAIRAARASRRRCRPARRSCRGRPSRPPSWLRAWPTSGRPTLDRVGQRLVLGHRDEGAGEPADRAGGRSCPPFLTASLSRASAAVEPGPPSLLDAHRLQNLADAVAHLRRGGQAQVDDPERRRPAARRPRGR